MREISKEQWVKNLEITYNNYRKQSKNAIGEELEPEFVELDYEKKEITYKFSPTMRCINMWGVVHGGVIASLMDSCMGIAARSYSGMHVTPTVNMNISYLEPHKIDQCIYFKVRINSCGGRLCNLSIYSWQDNEMQKSASGEGTYYLINQPLVRE